MKPGYALFFSEAKKDDKDPGFQRPEASRTRRATVKPNDGSKEAVGGSQGDDSCTGNNNGIKKTPTPMSTAKKTPLPVRFFGILLRTTVVDLPLTLVFAALVAAVVLHKVHDEYLLKQLQLMRFQLDGRDFDETMYYHRYCGGDDVSATSVSQLLIPMNATAEECAEHQLIHGASLYRDLLTPETASELRAFIVEENMKQEGFQVIENEFRYSWGIDVNMHPSIKKYWKELASNKLLVDALEEIMGPDPAIIEFTAITSAFGAKDQHDHQDVVPPGSAAKFAQSFIPSYSLFIPLQDTSYDMGATHVCPGTHLCSDGCDNNCPKHNLAMSGEADNWPTGWGALVNQQTTHKGMGHTKEGGLDRVVIIATFAPRPQTFRQLETRMIAQGGSYSLAWHQWGHTFSDFVHADERMWEPLKTMRALGIVKGRGWNLPTVASMRISNSDAGYNNEDGLYEFIEDKGGFSFLPRKWQGALDEEDAEDDPPDAYDDNVWHPFLLGTLKRTEQGLKDLYKVALPLVLLTLAGTDAIRSFWMRRWSWPSNLVGGIGRLVVLHSLVVIIALWGMQTIEESNWAKDIASGKSYRLPELVSRIGDDAMRVTQATLPNELDVLRVPHYASDYMAAYSRVVDFAHPGNVKWRGLVITHAQGYLGLTREMQNDFCKSLIAFVVQDARFLKHGEEREWLPITDGDELLDICHQDLVAASDKRVAAMIRQLDSLELAAKYGRFRNSSMQRNIIPTYLKHLKLQLIPQIVRPGQTAQRTKATESRFELLRQTLSARRVVAPRKDYKRRYTIPKSLEPQEPFPLAWLREGDLVESLYHCDGVAYYRGRVVAIVSADATFDVVYDDGDVDEGLELRCMRPYRPYQVGEIIQVRKAEAEWVKGTILDIYEDEKNEGEAALVFDVKLEDSKIVLAEIPSGDIRRLEIQRFHRFEHVAARYLDGDEWFPGKISRTNADGTYNVRYEDGDIELSVPIDRIQKLG